MFMGLPKFCNRFRKDMILSDLVILVASWTRFKSAQTGRAGKGVPQEKGGGGEGEGFKLGSAR